MPRATGSTARSCARTAAWCDVRPDRQRPFRTHIDPSRDGSEVVDAIADPIRVEFYRRVGIEELFPPLTGLWRIGHQHPAQPPHAQKQP
ncbi:hypothetical protein GCM10023080_092250 [Streptomyces pseudoechinosporeus]